jgi:hypothetical protein
LIDFDGAGAFDLDGVKFLVLDNEILSFGNLIPPRYVLPRNNIARFGIHILLLQPVAGLSIESIEADFFAEGGGGIEGNWARDEGQPKVTLPIGARGHFDTPTELGRQTIIRNLANVLALV